MLLTIAIISFLGLLLAMILAPDDKGSTITPQGVERAEGLAPVAQV